MGTLIGVGIGLANVGAWFITAALTGLGPLGLLLTGALLCWMGMMLLVEWLGLVL